MTLSQFNCPHCHSPFQVDTSVPATQVGCPHCQQPVALMNEPPVVEAPPIEAPPVESVPDTPPVIEADNSLPRGYSPADLLPPGAVVPQEACEPEIAAVRDPINEDYLTRQRASDERASRKFVKNLIVWVGCAIVLVSVLAYFVMRAGS